MGRKTLWVSRDHGDKIVHIWPVRPVWNGHEYTWPSDQSFGFPGAITAELFHGLLNLMVAPGELYVFQVQGRHRKLAAKPRPKQSRPTRRLKPKKPRRQIHVLPPEQRGFL